MQFTTFFIFLALVASSLAKPQRTGDFKGDCWLYDYGNQPAPNWWAAPIDLLPSERPTDSFMTVVASFKAMSGNRWGGALIAGPYERYTYTMHATVGKGDDGMIDIYAERSRGKGLGQHFRVNFIGHDGNNLVSYWINANDRCSIKTPFPLDMLKKITTEWKDTTT